MKTQRQAKIMEIISNKNVETQEQLLAELQAAGFHSTQATISRDIKELRIIKELTSFGTYRYCISANEVSSTFSGKLNAIFRECITSFDYAQNILVIHTLPGLASAAASAPAAASVETAASPPVLAPSSDPPPHPANKVAVIAATSIKLSTFFFIVKTSLNIFVTPCYKQIIATRFPKQHIIFFSLP